MKRSTRSSEMSKRRTRSIDQSRAVLKDLMTKMENQRRNVLSSVTMHLSSSAVEAHPESSSRVIQENHDRISEGKSRSSRRRYSKKMDKKRKRDIYGTNSRLVDEASLDDQQRNDCLSRRSSRSSYSKLKTFFT